MLYCTVPYCTVQDRTGLCSLWFCTGRVKWNDVFPSRETRRKRRWLPLVSFLCACFWADEEDERRARKEKEKWERKRARKEKEEVLEELVPKATGREAMIEKRKVRREEAKAREDSPELVREKDVLGGGDDFQSRYSTECRLKSAVSCSRIQCSVPNVK